MDRFNQFQLHLENMKCRQHSSQEVDLFLNDPNETDIFKCSLCIRKNPVLISKVTSISSIFAEGQQKIALNLCCEDSDLCDEAQQFVDSSKDLLDKINESLKEIEAHMHDLFENIKQEFITKAKSILAQKTALMQEYNKNCGRNLLKMIIENTNLNREEKEMQLQQFNGELNAESNRKQIKESLTKLTELNPQISLEKEEIKKDIVNMLIKKLSFTFSCDQIEQNLTSGLTLCENNNIKQKTISQIDIHKKIIEGGEYVGQLVGELRHGIGAQTQLNGNLYIGEFKDGKQNGLGILTWINGQKYVGEFKDGQQNGQGSHAWPDGFKYVGEFKNGQRNGQETQTQVGGFKYKGQFRDAKFDGQGTYSWPDGIKYIGEWKDGFRNGQGTNTWPDGQKYKGEWENNKFHGQGALTTINGEIQSGLWQDHKFIGNQS